MARNYDKIGPFTLTAIESGEHFSFPSEDASLFYIFIPFNPGDCYSCFKEVPYWKELETKLAGQVKIIGIISSTSSKKARYFLDQQEIQIPVLLDQDNIFMTENGFFPMVITPAKILADRDGHIIDISKTTYDDKSLQNVYLNQLELWLSVDTRRSEDDSLSDTPHHEVD